MKLYLVSQSENDNYDTFSSFVVCCETEEEARNTHPGWGEDPWKDDFSHSTWCKLPSAAEVEYIGEAAEDLEKGIVCASFHAG